MIKQAFDARRKQYMSLMGKDAVAVIPSAQVYHRNADATFPYRQSSDLYYLLGCKEPEVTLVLRPGASTEQVVAFVRPRDKERETWDGRRLGVDGALAHLGVDAAYPTTELRERLPKLISGYTDLYYSLADDSEFDELMLSIVSKLRRGGRSGLSAPLRIVDPRHSLHECRLIKGEDEIQRLERAAEISAEAHCKAMQLAAPGVMEYELAAQINATFQSNGCAGPGYESIVGTGDNATILHYIENDQALEQDDLVLIDAGGEYDFYTADITRTFPVSGRFNEGQRELYQVVLDTQIKAIEMVKPGVTMDEIHDFVVEDLTAGMIKLGLLQGEVSDRIKDKSYRRFYMHRTSHWLGMDVHDVGLYTVDQKPRPFQAGMVLTIEPGLYVSKDSEDVPPKYLGIGIRIEDDVVVTPTGHRVLTHGVPKEIKEIEEMCNVSPSTYVKL